MPENTAVPASGFELQAGAREDAPLDTETRLRRAELFLQLPGQIDYSQPLDSVLSVLCEAIVTRSPAAAAGIAMLEHDSLETVALGACNLPPEYLEGMKRARIESRHGDALRTRSADGGSWVLRNARDYMLAEPDYAHMREIIPALPFDTIVATPIATRPGAMGFVYLYYAGEAGLDSETIDFARALAEFARPIIDNALLFSQAERRRTELEALSRADIALHRSLELEDVYQAMIDLAVELFGADRSLFLTFDEQDEFHACVTRGVPEEHLAGLQPIYRRMRREDFAEHPPEVRMVENVDEANLAPGVRNFTTSRSVVDIPVFVEGEFFGIFVLGYHQQRRFTADDRRLFDTLAARAGLALHNALLLKESRRRTTELEAFRRADDALHASLRLDDVVEAMVELASHLLNADSSLLATFTPNGHLGVVASKGLPARIMEAVNATYKNFDHAYFDSLGKPSPIVIVEDLRQSKFVDQRLHSASLGSTAEIPVVVDGEVWGVFSVGWRRRRVFSAGERAMLESFGSHASLAIQNALIFEASLRRAKELEALAAADEALHRSLQIDDVQEAMVDLALQMLGASSSLVVTWDEHDRLAVGRYRGIPDALRDLINARYQQLGREYFAQRRRGAAPSFVAEVQGHPQLTGFDPRVRGSVAEIPIYVGGEPWGFFAVGWRDKRPFSAEDRQLLETFANRATLAIQNAVLFERAQLSASMEERQRIARDLHDSVSQALYGIGLGARTLKRRMTDETPHTMSDPVDYILNLAEGGLAETRALIFELMPDSLRTDGLVSALQRQAAAVQARHNIQVAAILCDEPDLPLRTKEALYRIAQESLSNMARHAQAQEASVRFEANGAGYRLAIEDNGRGFDTGGEFPGHLGLRSMQERAAKVGAACRIESTPGEGTRVTVDVV